MLNDRLHIALGLAEQTFVVLHRFTVRWIEPQRFHVGVGGLVEATELLEHGSAVEMQLLVMGV